MFSQAPQSFIIGYMVLVSEQAPRSTQYLDISGKRFRKYPSKKTSLLRRLQAQTLPDATLPIGKINPFSKIAITFDPVMKLLCPLRFSISYNFLNQ